MDKSVPTVFKLLGIAPFKKAEFTQDNLYTRKQPLSSEDCMTLHASLLKTKSSKNLSSNGNKNEEMEMVEAKHHGWLYKSSCFKSCSYKCNQVWGAYYGSCRWYHGRYGCYCYYGH